ncbi:hypothetical protein M9H77_23564 [Catharanthus roseus]|uniref:Uncharacterized protein n=1 Tax=Catharanthus roseus TaxID=4058 RepID=A0ACC0AU32_CATRO|nr:hypothetical protein M9H77_23564 [Catharanthus roseus]
MALVYMLLVSCEVPVSQQYWRKRISPSLALAHHSRVELVLLPRLSLTRFKSFVLHSLAITRRERSKQGAYYHIEKEAKHSNSYYRKTSIANHIDKPRPTSARIDRAGEDRRGWISERLKESILKTEAAKGSLLQIRTNRIDSTDMIDGMMRKVLIRPICIGRKLTFFHTLLVVDATAAITLDAGGKWLSDTLDVLFGKLDVYSGAIVLPNHSARDAFVCKV